MAQQDAGANARYRWQFRFRGWMLVGRAWLSSRVSPPSHTLWFARATTELSVLAGGFRLGRAFHLAERHGGGIFHRGAPHLFAQSQPILLMAAQRRFGGSPISALKI